MEAPFVYAKSRAGRCFELSYRSATSYSDWTLAHGVVRMTPGCDERLMVHAWVEKDAFVHDPVLNKTYPKDLYYRSFVIPTAKLIHYSANDAARHGLQSLQSGPWDTHLKNWSHREFTIDEYCNGASR